MKEREADFDRRVKAFKSTHPSIGSDNDVLQLNVGGQTNIAVRRSTLTQFEDSMLAAKFSGRWDDSMEKDRDGNIFIHQDPESFVTLIKHLRLRMNSRTRSIPYRRLPTPSYEFCSMLEYYNLIPGVYPQRWVGTTKLFTREEVAYGTVTLSSKNIESEDASSSQTATAVLTFKGMPEVIEFSAEFHEGASGAIGWLHCNDEGIKTRVPDSLLVNRITIAYSLTFQRGKSLDQI